MTFPVFFFTVKIENLSCFYFRQDSNFDLSNFWSRAGRQRGRNLSSCLSSHWECLGHKLFRTFIAEIKCVKVRWKVRLLSILTATFCGVIASLKLECKCKRLLWTEYWYSKLFRLLMKVFKDHWCIWLLKIQFQNTREWKT